MVPLSFGIPVRCKHSCMWEYILWLHCSFSNSTFASLDLHLGPITSTNPSYILEFSPIRSTVRPHHIYILTPSEVHFPPQIYTFPHHFYRLTPLDSQIGPTGYTHNYTLAPSHLDISPIRSTLWTHKMYTFAP
jgi:hypothetical protein